MVDGTDSAGQFVLKPRISGLAGQQQGPLLTGRSGNSWLQHELASRISPINHRLIATHLIKGPVWPQRKCGNDPQGDTPDDWPIKSNETCISGLKSNSQCDSHCKPRPATCLVQTTFAHDKHMRLLGETMPEFFRSGHWCQKLSGQV